MLFNSITFLVFFSLFFILYWIIQGKTNIRNVFILISSYVFYAWWDWRFLGLIIFSTIVDYVLGMRIEKERRRRYKKFYLALSLTANLGLLAYFKYFNFFISSFVDLMNTVSVNTNLSSLNIILPVGISFYTFQTLSYTIDVYRGKLMPNKNFVQFAAFVSFFPQLVAGPIERATKLLSQFDENKKFSFNNAKIGLSQILWGYFKKVVIADNCAIYADTIFNNYEQMGAGELAIGAILFAFQIYCDFSAYSDIAIGISRLLGFDLMTNFRYPYFSRDIAEFWRRWHISLSTWFRDYLYIPLGGSKVGLSRKIVNIFIIFLVSGIWHGANWTFVVWGALNALYFMPLMLLNLNRKNLDFVADGGIVNTLKEIPAVLITFISTCFAWIYFRSASVTDANAYLKGIFSFESSKSNLVNVPSYIWVLIFFLLLIDFFNRKKDFVFFEMPVKQIAFTTITGILIVLFGYFTDEKSFIYFQF